MQNTCRHILPEAGPPEDAARGLMANPVRYDRIPLDQVPSAVLTWSVCWHLSEHKKKMYPYVNPNTQKFLHKIFKTHLIEDFFHLPLMSVIPMGTLNCEYFQIFKIIRNCPVVIIRDTGENDLREKPDPVKVHKHEIFFYFFGRNWILMAPTACNTRILKIVYDLAEIFDF